MQNSMRIAVLALEVAQLASILHTIAAMGYECHSFTEGRKLLRDMREQSFDLVVLDWTLRYMPGLMVVRWIRLALANPLPILVMGSHCEEAEIVRGLDAGANHFMTLPLRMGEFEARVAALLRRASSLGEFSVKETCRLTPRCADL
jgi:DNA-binding response OmpR family regulator